MVVALVMLPIGFGSLLYLGFVNDFVTELASRVVSVLANDQRVRQRSLFFGALLITISTILQFLATFESAK
jgi:hypothetical protein